jgi:two-component system nitrogen regulation response regulator NtrX
LKGKKKILIVDDDEGICKTLGLILEDEGFIIDVANSGKEALKKSETSNYNVVLLDIRLPDIEGTKLLKAFRQSTPKMIKIMMTGFPQIGNAIEALNLGADAYFMKPVHPDDVIKTIREKLEVQTKEEALTEEKLTAFLEARTKELLDNLH